jgi:hypothetical protein
MIFRGTESVKSVTYLHVLYSHVSIVSDMFVSLLQSVTSTNFWYLLEFSFVTYQCVTNTNLYVKLELIY